MRNFVKSLAGTNPMAWKHVLIKIVPQVVTALVNWLAARRRREEYEERQEKRDAVADDPGGTFADHFGGMRDDGPAAETDEADVDKR